MSDSRRNGVNSNFKEETEVTLANSTERKPYAGGTRTHDRHGKPLFSWISGSANGDLIFDHQIFGHGPNDFLGLLLVVITTDSAVKNQTIIDLLNLERTNVVKFAFSKSALSFSQNFIGGNNNHDGPRLAHRTQSVFRVQLRKGSTYDQVSRAFKKVDQ